MNQQARTEGGDRIDFELAGQRRAPNCHVDALVHERSQCRHETARSTEQRCGHEQRDDAEAKTDDAVWRAERRDEQAAETHEAENQLSGDTGHRHPNRESTSSVLRIVAYSPERLASDIACTSSDVRHCPEKSRRPNVAV